MQPESLTDGLPKALLRDLSSMCGHKRRRMWDKQMLNTYSFATCILCYQPPQPEEIDLFSS